ncbi:hypothetical protein O9992_12375 [Vibrio lentus]|nr:hypothetical protein [Vibrio lentus]
MYHQFVLLNIGAGLARSRHMTQRVLTCKKMASKAFKGRAIKPNNLHSSSSARIHVYWLALLYVFYQRPELMGVEGKVKCANFNGENVTIFMYHVLNEMPGGLRLSDCWCRRSSANVQPG